MLLAGLFLAVTAGSVEPAAPAPVIDEPPRNWVNFRLGGSTGTRNGRPEMCLEAAPLSFVAVEGCGTGSGFLHSDPEPEIAHFRVKLRILRRKTAIGWIEPRFGVGFSELQVGTDDPGFHFTGPSPSGTETSGPEASLAVRSLIPLGRGFEGVLEASLFAAWLPYAPDLVEPASEIQVNASITFGVGF